MRTLLYASTLIFLLSATAFGEIIKSGSLQAYSDGMNVYVRWATEDESNIAYFEIERSTAGSGGFASIAVVNTKGTSVYEFVDNAAFQRITTLYQYRIKIVYSNGTPPTYSQSLSVSHTVSGVRRTWGSIKAMFR